MPLIPFTTLTALTPISVRDDHNLSEEVQRYLSEIESRQYMFDRAEREAAELSALTQAELCGWAKSMLLGDGRRALCVHSHEGAISKPHEQPMPEGATRLVEGVAEFKRGLSIYRRPDLPMPKLQPDPV